MSEHNDAYQILKLQKNLLLKGPTGSGKTRLAENLSRQFNQKLYSINCSVDVDIEALLGFKTIEYKKGEQHIVFINGPVIKAMETGGILYIDEINMARPEVLPVLNALLDHRRTLVNPLTNQIHHANNNFKVIAAINIGYVGTTPLNAALLNRFNVMEINYPDKERLLQILKDESMQKDNVILNQIVAFHSDLNTLFKQNQISQESLSVRSLIDFADLSTQIEAKSALNYSIINKLESEQEQRAILNAFLINF